MNFSANTPISELPGVGEQYNQKLEKLNIYTVQDLLFHTPTRYEDFTNISPIQDLQLNQNVTIQGQITQFQNIFTRRGKKIQHAYLSDGQASLPVVWFNQTYLERVMQPGTWVSLSGRVGEFNNQISLVAPKFEKIPPIETTPEIQTTHTGGLISVYPETAGISSKWLRAKIKYLLRQPIILDDWIQELPQDLKFHIPNLIPLSQALQHIHFPETNDQIQTARHRLAFDELFFMQLNNLLLRSQWHQDQTAPIMDVTPVYQSQFVANLPFQLTGAQLRVSQQILSDLQQSTPMNRLVQGDVGSGKTVIAAFAAYIVIKNGYQVALMAPTEILAQQHYHSLNQFLKPLDINVVLQTSSNKYIKPGKDKPFDLITGTHALISDYINFDRLGLVIIDEQHRFGVNQRAKLISKANLKTNDQGQMTSSPHVLNMTATPIPRTITLTLYGDLDVSTIDEMPPGRKPVKTWVVPRHKRASAYQWITNQIITHQSQAFIVCPFIEPSETMQTVKAATEEFENLQSIFKSHTLGLLHGQLKSAEKELILQQFRDGKYHILVTTPVVEVGVDIPNATIMLIEAAERFGLAQLHQLRGRVGRSSKDSYCLLFTSTQEAESSRRLQAMEQTNSGMELAETDLKIRGPGALYGTQQHGYQEFKHASYSDVVLINQTRSLAEQITPQIEKFPNLRKKLQTDTIHIAPN